MKKGFTLVELLVVLVVIGILIALILPNTLKAIERSNVVEHDSDMRTINQAIMMCYTETRDWDSCGAITDLTDGDYLDDDFPATGPFGETYGIDDAPAGVASQGKVSTCSGTIPDGAEFPCA